MSLHDNDDEPLSSIQNERCALCKSVDWRTKPFKYHSACTQLLATGETKIDDRVFSTRYTTPVAIIHPDHHAHVSCICLKCRKRIAMVNNHLHGIAGITTFLFVLSQLISNDFFSPQPQLDDKIFKGIIFLLAFHFLCLLFYYSLFRLLIANTSIAKRLFRLIKTPDTDDYRRQLLNSLVHKLHEGQVSIYEPKLFETTIRPLGRVYYTESDWNNLSRNRTAP